MSHADILDIDRGHIFRKHRHKNNKKVAVIYEKTVKKPAVARVFARQLTWGACIKSAISHVRCAYAHIFDTESYNARAYIWRGRLCVQTERQVAARSLTLHDRSTEGNWWENKKAITGWKLELFLEN